MTKWLIRTGEASRTILFHDRRLMAVVLLSALAVLPTNFSVVLISPTCAQTASPPAANPARSGANAESGTAVKSLKPDLDRRPALAKPPIVTVSPRSIADLQNLESAFERVYDKALAATVAIRAGAAHGCGVIVSEGGHVLTAAHVAGWPGRELILKLSDGRRAKARTMGLNHEADAALVQITDAGPWPFLNVGKSAEVSVGQWCVALGYPGGHEPGRKPALRVGRVLALGRNESALLTDCTLIGGDSGGPLLNLSGEIIGINSRIGADLAANLHVPVDEFRKNRARYLSSESWGQDGYLGITEVSDGISGRKVVIAAVDENSPAGRAGLRKGDQITRIAEVDVKSIDDLRNREKTCRPGTAVVVKVRRDGSEQSFEIKVVESPTPPHSDEDSELLETFLRTTGWVKRPIDEVGKNHRLVKKAASSAVSRAKESTVQVFSRRRPVALGTIVSEDGYIITKASEVVRSDKLECRLFGRTARLPAQLVNQDNDHDLALLKIDAANLVPVKWAATDEPHIGSWLASSTTSSEPLLLGNMSSATDRIQRERPLLGVKMVGSVEYPEVREVIAGSAADNAGLQPGDRILSAGKQSLRDKQELIDLISQHWPGEPLKLTIRRGEDELNMSVALGSESDADAEMSGFREFNGGDLSNRRSGFDAAFRHDSPLLPYHCGGPVVNLRGECVGINIARAERVASYAIPAGKARSIVDNLLNQQGSVTVTASKAAD